MNYCPSTHKCVCMCLCCPCNLFVGRMPKGMLPQPNSDFASKLNEKFNMSVNFLTVSCLRPDAHSAHTCQTNDIPNIPCTDRLTTVSAKKIINKRQWMGTIGAFMDMKWSFTKNKTHWRQRQRRMNRMGWMNEMGDRRRVRERERNTVEWTTHCLFLIKISCFCVVRVLLRSCTAQLPFERCRRHLVFSAASAPAVTATVVDVTVTVRPNGMLCHRHRTAAPAAAAATAAAAKMCTSHMHDVYNRNQWWAWDRDQCEWARERDWATVYSKNKTKNIQVNKQEKSALALMYRMWYITVHRTHRATQSRLV